MLVREIIACLEKRNANSSGAGTGSRRELDVELASLFSKYGLKQVTDPEFSSTDVLDLVENVQEYGDHSPNTTALHVACRLHDYEAISLLISYGANINACDGQGRTPLYVAVIKRDLPLCEYLCAVGANPHQPWLGQPHCSPFAVALAADAAIDFGSSTNCNSTNSVDVMYRALARGMGVASNHWRTTLCPLIARALASRHTDDPDVASCQVCHSCVCVCLASALIADYAVDGIAPSGEAGQHTSWQMVHAARCTGAVGIAVVPVPVPGTRVGADLVTLEGAGAWLLLREDPSASASLLALDVEMLYADSGTTEAAARGESVAALMRPQWHTGDGDSNSDGYGANAGSRDHASVEVTIVSSPSVSHHARSVKSPEDSMSVASSAATETGVNADGVCLGMFSAVLQLATNALTHEKQTAQCALAPFDYERYYRALAAEAVEEDNDWLSSLAREAETANSAPSTILETSEQLDDNICEDSESTIPTALVMDAAEEEEVAAALAAMRKKMKQALGTHEDDACQAQIVEAVAVKKQLYPALANTYEHVNAIDGNADNDADDDHDDWVTNQVVVEDGGFRDAPIATMTVKRMTVESGAGSDTSTISRTITHTRDVTIAPGSLWARIEAGEWSGNEE